VQKVRSLSDLTLTQPHFFFYYMKHIFIITFLVFNFSIRAQDIEIKIFTQKGCGNCAYVKKFLQERNINYQEFDLADRSVAESMMVLIRTLQYKGDIILPVIVFKGEMLHPAMKLNDTIRIVDLNAALRFITVKDQVQDSKLYQINEKVVDSNTECSYTYQNTQKAYYVISKHFQQSEEAIKELGKLNQAEYLNAMVLFDKGIFKLAIERFSNEVDAKAYVNMKLTEFPVLYVLQF